MRKKKRSARRRRQGGDNAGESAVCAGCRRRERVYLVWRFTAVLRGAARGGAEDRGETEREKKSEAAALREQRRKMGALHLVVVRWW